MRSTFLDRAGSAARRAVFAFGLTVATLVGSVALVLAQGIPALVELSPETSAGRPDLASRRSALVQEREALHARVNQHNGRCKNIDPNDKAKLSDCANEQAALFSDMKSHIARSEAFNTAARSAATSHQNQILPSPVQVVTKRLEYHGDFAVLTVEGRQLPTTSDVPIATGTKIITLPNSEVKLTLLDDTQLILGAQAELVIEEFLYDPTSFRAKSILNLVKGELRWLNESSRCGSWTCEHKIRTPGVVTSTRGTDVEILVAPDGPGYIKLFEGQLEITETKTGDVFLMNSRQMVTLKPDGTVGRPVPLKLEKKTGST